MIPREQLERWKEWTEARAALLDMIGEGPSGDVLYLVAIPALIAEVEAQAKEIERLRDVLARVVKIEQRRTYNTCPDCDTPEVCKRTMQCTVASDTEELCRAALKETP